MTILRSAPVLLLVLVGVATLALVSAQTPVELTEDNFDSLTANGEWLIAFTAPWCGHCKTLAPVWIQAAAPLPAHMAVTAAAAAQASPSSSSSRGNNEKKSPSECPSLLWDDQPTKTHSSVMQLGKVDCTAHSALAGKFGVRGYPTIKHFSNGAVVADYKGARTVAAILEFAERTGLPAIAKALKDETLASLAGKTEAVVVLVGHDPCAQPEEEEVFLHVAKLLQSQVAFAVATRDAFVAYATKVSGAAVTAAAEIEGPILAVLKDGKVFVFDADNVGLDDPAQFNAFVATNRFPLLPELTSVCVGF